MFDHPVAIALCVFAVLIIPIGLWVAWCEEQRARQQEEWEGHVDDALTLNDDVDEVALAGLHELVERPDAANLIGRRNLS